MEIDHRILDKEAINRFEQYSLAKPSLNGGVVLDQCQETNSQPSVSKTPLPKPRQKIVCCFCFKTTKYRRKQLIVGSITNFAIFCLLLAYTFLGSFIFLAIEGGNDFAARPKTLPNINQISLNSSSEFAKPASTEESSDREFMKINASLPSNYFWEERKKAVESIWEITVSLNILYRENWTQLAAQEITKFQNELVRRITAEMVSQYGEDYKEMALGGAGKSGITVVHEEHEWNLALAFFYSLTVLTTIGYGNIAPRTTLGKAATIGYALFGIPLTLVYLSSVGSLLSKLARSVFTRALCCCLCSNCGYCCYDERRMAEKERRMKLKRQQQEVQKEQKGGNGSSEECYVLKPSGTQHKDHLSTDKLNETSSGKDDVISWPDTDSKLSMHGLSILAPVLLCLCAIFIYIILGSLVLYHINNMDLLDGFYFCFMALSTIGFGNLVPGTNLNTINGVRYYSTESTTVWFCSVYTLTGLALTAMCFGVIHDEIIHRIKHQQKQWSQKSNVVNDGVSVHDGLYMAS